tara:strand:- start:1502 stop:4000 length:2499 start_codon:yes stop_codon:yes gene_type:complete
MGLFNTVRMGASGAGDAYEISRSLRFDDDDSPRLNFTASSAGNRQKWTKSFWLKRGQIMRTFLTAYYISGADVAAIEIDDNHHLQFYDFYNGYRLHLVTTQKFRDPTAWMHVLVNIDTTQSTSSERAKIYINGERVTSFSTETYPSQNLNVSFNQNVLEAWGTEGTNQRLHFDGYLAEIYMIDGQQLDPSNFGKTDPVTNQWVPIEYTGTFGTNGYHLDFSDNTNNTEIGRDRSGNGNDWTPVNIASSHDVVPDTPTNNFCTLNDINDSKAGSNRNANLRYTGGGGNGTIASTFGISPSDSKGYYFESKIISGNQANRLFVGIGYTSTDWRTQDARGANNDSWVLRNGDGVFIHNSSVDGETSGAGALSVGDIIQIAVKGSNIWVGKNNTWLFSGDPANNSTPKFNDVNETWTPVADVMTSNVINFNFGQDSTFGTGSGYQGNTDANGHGDFYYTPPSGFFALCSANLPDPTIKLPNKYFDILTWTGNSTNNRSITGLQFQPDFVWIKKRTSSLAQHSIVNSITGTSDNSTGNGNVGDLDSADSGGEAARSAGGFESFDANGFTLGKGSNDNNADSAYQLNNASGQTYVAWNWNGGGSTATNNDGSITTQVRANPTAGFSVISYTGGGSAGTIGHGLGVAPQAIITKRRSAIEDWKVFHQDISAAHFLKLNATQVQTSNTNVYPNTAPTSTVYSVGSHDSVTGNNDTYIAFCFSEVAGYSKFGSYTGNGSTDGTFIFTGFRPAWLMVKAISQSSGYWLMLDSTRRTFNPNGISSSLYANENSTENTFGNATGIDFVANGFKIRDDLVFVNASNQTIVYFAFAESPFKYSRAR